MQGLRFKGLGCTGLRFKGQEGSGARGADANRPHKHQWRGGMGFSTSGADSWGFGSSFRFQGSSGFRVCSPLQ